MIKGARALCGALDFGAGRPEVYSTVERHALKRCAPRCTGHDGAEAPVAPVTICDKDDANLGSSFGSDPQETDRRIVPLDVTLAIMINK
ncbi:MAG: hypothetical protein FWH32_06765 [Clostridiales bacterium]|nr:hypothetical protein [Clostridiales bacterium]